MRAIPSNLLSPSKNTPSNPASTAGTSGSAIRLGILIWIMIFKRKAILQIAVENIESNTYLWRY